ncbi:MAG: hydrogenase accessory protein HypB [Thermoprotei archaeon]|nr:MAG: hydrogenase accessory protein HypB [Thermoprotei archaeon]RLF13460.1 MAG: hydrogenase accessory protein HypB [Thermoprotei archaeon]
MVTSEEGEVLDIELEEDFIKRNDELAAENRRLVDAYGVRVLDVMGSIGSGKTTLIEKLVSKLKDRYKIAVIAGDVATTIDADRLKKLNVPSIQVNTGRECHLDANLVKKALSKLDLKNLDLVFIENVGNLICPADFKLGAHFRLVVISVTEGPYVVSKHPLVFLEADVAIINKIDLAEAMEVEPDKLVEEIKRVKPWIKVVKTSLKKGLGIDEVVEALGL